MEPLRKCQQAQFFAPVRMIVTAIDVQLEAFLFDAKPHCVVQCDDKAHPTRNGSFLTPCEDDPPCAYCHMKLSSCRLTCSDCKSPCRRCGALRMQLYDLAGRGFSDEKLRPPMVSMVTTAHVYESSLHVFLAALHLTHTHYLMTAGRLHEGVGALDCNGCFQRAQSIREVDSRVWTRWLKACTTDISILGIV